MYNNAYNVYKNNSITYASKDQLLLMIVDGAVKFSKIAREALKEGNVRKAHENLIKTQDIFSELMISLDTNSEEWAKNIFNIYEFIKESLVKANLKKDIEELEKIIPLIEEVRDLWYEVEKKSKK